jgi:hypothetical protein
MSLRGPSSCRGSPKAVSQVIAWCRARQTVTEVQSVEVAPPKDAGRAEALRELAPQLDAGAVYDRDLPAITGSVEVVITALRRRPTFRHRWSGPGRGAKSRTNETRRWP